MLPTESSTSSTTPQTAPLTQKPTSEAGFISETTKKTALFIKNNWRQLVAYVFAWAVIFSCIGLMYGFEAVAFKLAIGMGGGILLGSVGGMLFIAVFDKEGKWTLWNSLNQTLETIDPNGTRQIVLAVAVTVLLAASVTLPYHMGAAYGLFIGSQLAVKIYTEKNLGSDPEKVKNQITALRLKVTEFENGIKNFNERATQAENVREQSELSSRIAGMQEQLDQLKAMLTKVEPVAV